MEAGELQRLLNEHLPPLRAFVRLRTNQMIRDRESHSDLVQSVCREVLEGVGELEYRGDGAFRGWLYTAALRKIVERDRYYKAQKRDVGRNVRADPGGGSAAGLVDAYATVTTPSAVLSAQEGMEQLESAFDELPEDYREVITLARIAGLSHEQISERMGKSVEASRQLLRRATVRLAMILER